jgi:hypothetical protein
MRQIEIKLKFYYFLLFSINALFAHALPADFVASGAQRARGVALAFRTSIVHVAMAKLATITARASVARMALAFARFVRALGREGPDWMALAGTAAFGQRRAPMVLKAQITVGPSGVA